jgi:hypothetical protein
LTKEGRWSTIPLLPPTTFLPSLKKEAIIKEGTMEGTMAGRRERKPGRNKRRKEGRCRMDGSIVKGRERRREGKLKNVEGKKLKEES